jgi:hypothetical protein
LHGIRIPLKWPDAVSRRNQRQKAQRRDKSVGILLGLAGVMFIAALGGGAWYIRKQKIALDPETNCPKTGPGAVHVLIFDRSDPINGQQAQRIRQTIQQFKNSAEFGHRFDIYTFEGDEKNVLTPILTVCSPGRPENANELIENPEFVRRNYERKFSAVLASTVDFLLEETTKSNSPIIESIRAAAASSFGPLGSSSTRLRVTMISDMVQHSALYSQFRSEPNFAQLAKTPNWPSIRPNLHGADVDILYLLRPTAKRNNSSIQNRAHQLFWEQLIGDSQGHLNSIEPI